ncbi:UvrD-helicase domain-containing protein [Paenibacillus sp. ACRRX]|uniref:RNA polymerase recycling motor HelD n=1 Tax=Paenibacillus sp. ACRRX TaxID=2918206 RepID=UPI001EF728ED|nr:RNA polymerase recycling motor HelD [Paenibacillus sp. ACRRX]MCG7409940.1 UvrD-helicase domain-containing protein [Paenibacillus sp. ACRRX]
MSTDNQEWLNEQERVNRIVAEIHDRIEVLGHQVSDVRTDIVDIRKTFWDDVTVNFEDGDEAAETAASIKQQAELMSERERSHRHAQKQMKTLARLEQSPYFGRIDFKETGEPGADKVYLGIASLLDKSGMEFLIYDWRAPVSSLYYDYPPGPAKYETPGGAIDGEMQLKRQFIIRNGRISSMFDTGVTIGDELLKEVLGKQADSQMKSIVATIQSEQNRIIRNEHSRLLVVQGAAGSGKTSAALQRVAYLLYRYRQTLSAEQIVLFSPNPMFNHYVSTVLPELGEENMQQVTYQEFLDHRLSPFFAVEDPIDLLEYEHSARDDAAYGVRMAAVSYKSSVSFMETIERYVEYLGREGMIFKSIYFHDDVIVSAERLCELFYSYSQAISIPNRVDMLKDWILKQLKAYSRTQTQKPWVEEQMELLEKEDYLWAHQELRRRRGSTPEEDTFDDFDREQELMAIKIVQDALKPLRNMVKKLMFIDLQGIYMQLFENTRIAASLQSKLPNEWAGITRMTTERLYAGILLYEDTTPYLDLQGRIEGVHVNTSIRHVFIDEGQDYSPYQYFFVKRMFPRSRMTVLGDLNQAIFTHAGSGSGLQAIKEHYDDGETETFVLTQSYRSTRQIVEFTRQLIKGGEVIQPFNRNGVKPTLMKVPDEAALIKNIAQRIQSLQAEGYQSIAVICKTAAESERAHAALKDLVQLRLIGKNTASFERGTLVIPSYLAKGVEFDAVLVYNTSAEHYAQEGERKLFYTACTRAMHELYMYYTGERSPFINEVGEDSYVHVEGN